MLLIKYFHEFSILNFNEKCLLLLKKWIFQGVLEGYNGTVFAYGQTGCGKSFTMQGVHNPASQRGIIPRSFEHIFEAIDSSENMKYLVHASYLEIYNEDIHDLLGPDAKKRLDLKEHPDKGVYVPGTSYVTSDALKIVPNTVLKH